MTDKQNSWREKYLQALDDQERQEGEFSAQQDLLRRAIIRVSLAADGLDGDLDGKLKGLRHILRPQANKVPSLAEGQVSELEEAVMAFEGQRQARSRQAGDSLKALSEQLREMDLPKDVNGGLKRFQKGLKTRLDNLQEYPALLKEISSLQYQALESQKEERPGFFSRFMGGKKEVDSEEPASEEAKEVEVEQLEPERVDTEAAEKLAAEKSPDEQNSTEQAPQGGLSSGVDAEVDAGVGPNEQATSGLHSNQKGRANRESEGELIEGELIDGELSDEEPATEAVFQRPLHEPAFSKISAKVTRVLTELLEQVDASPCVVQKVDNAKQRIDRGLNWFELVPTLEDIRDLVMQAYLEADKEHLDYLIGVNLELEQIYQALTAASNSETSARQAGDLLQVEMTESVEKMQQSVANIDDVSELKGAVNHQIEAIQSALQQFQKQKDEQEDPLSSQLQALVERVQLMEKGAKQSKEAFEEQRYKALHDALTELPNREAYNERIHHEQHRWQRYKHPLTLAVCDIDFFKRVNDTYGHQAGDRVLKVISRAIAKRLREVDFMARYGGEEFVLIMPETSGESALGLLDKIREALATTPFHFKAEPVQITISIGIAEFTEGDTAESVFERADKALYEAKEGGRNRCELASAENASAETKPIASNS